jgi:TonB-dependent SusC/RagA subfamily outer membrane receptor
MRRPIVVGRPGPDAMLVLLLAAAGCRLDPPEKEPSPGGREPAASRAAGRGPTAGEGELDDGRRVREPEELLEGRFAGVRILRLPGGAIAVRIRGASSVQGSNEPLYVVDGMPIEPGPGGALTGINPADIVKIEVLKDIGSISFYGVRAANGVVLITTRRD